MIDKDACLKTIHTPTSRIDVDDSEVDHDQEPPPPPAEPLHPSKNNTITSPPGPGPISPPDADADATASATTKSLRRRAQNRAAQRAFRERRERYVAELEQRVRAMEARRDGLQQENERLRSVIVSLQGTIGAVYGGGGTYGGKYKAPDDSCEGGGRGRRARGGADADADAAAGATPPVLSVLPTRRPTRDGGESLADGCYGEDDGRDGDGEYGDQDGRDRLLSFAATWNLVQAHPGVRDGRVDLADMWERLKADGVPQPTGYMFRRSVVEAVLAFDDGDDDGYVKRQFVIL
ncbi:DNA-binding transcription factor yap1 [Diplodia seriata]